MVQRWFNGSEMVKKNVKPVFVQLTATFMDFRNIVFRIFNIYKYFQLGLEQTEV